MMNKKVSHPWAYLLGIILGVLLRGGFWVVSVYLAIMVLQYAGWL